MVEMNSFALWRFPVITLCDKLKPNCFSSAIVPRRWFCNFVLTVEEALCGVDPLKAKFQPKATIAFKASATGASRCDLHRRKRTTVFPLISARGAYKIIK